MGTDHGAHHGPRSRPDRTPGAVHLAPPTHLLVRGGEAVERAAGRAGGIARSVAGAPPVSRAVAVLEGLLDQLPAMGHQIHVVIEEVHAERAALEATRRPLRVLEAQLEVLEESLAPIEASLDRWEELRAWMRRRTDTGAGPG